MSNIVEADYRVVPERTLPVIASEILYIESQVAKTALDGAIQIGNKLKEAKEKVDHGQWENWCSENLNYSKSKAEKMMKIAVEYGDENSLYAKTYMCTDLSISKALSFYRCRRRRWNPLQKRMIFRHDGQGTGRQNQGIETGKGRSKYRDGKGNPGAAGADGTEK